MVAVGPSEPKKKKKFEGLQRTNVVTGAHLIKTNTYIGVKSRDAQFPKGKKIKKHVGVPLFRI